MRVAIDCILCCFSLRNTRSPTSKHFSCLCLLAWFLTQSWALLRWFLSCLKASSQSYNSLFTASTLISPYILLTILGGSRPYITSKGVVPIDSWYVVLNQYSAHGIQVTHSFGWSTIKHLKYVSNQQLVTSVWSSVWGWYVVLILRVVPCILKNSLQNKLMNNGSLSLITEFGIPCNLTTSLTKTFAIDLTVYGCFKGIKWLYFESLSTTTKIPSCPFDLGSPVIKSR